MSIKLFPIGYLTGSLDSKGTWSVGSTATTSFFEPNKGCLSQIQDTTLMSEFESHAISTRKKIPEFRSISYSYEDIWASEKVVIDRFYNLVNGKAGRFYVIDLSDQETITGYSKSGDNVTASIPDTHRFTTTSGRAGYWAAAWKPSTASLMIGKMVSINEDAAITYTASYGDLKARQTEKVYVYPVIEVLFANNLNSFKTGEFNPEYGNDRGYMYSGDVSFVQYGAG